MAARQQYDAYNDCLQRHGSQSRWIAFIDVDEFLFSPTQTPVPEMLTRYERWPGVGVHGGVYGGSGHLLKPDGLVIESYLHHTSEPLRNRWIKSIVDPSRTLHCFTSHAFRYRADGARAYAVDEQQRELSDKQPRGQPGSNSGWSLDISHDLYRINHYWTKSREEWNRKAARPDAMHGGDRFFVSIEWEKMQPTLSQQRDDAITVYAPALRRAMGVTGSACAT